MAASSECRWCHLGLCNLDHSEAKPKKARPYQPWSEKHREANINRLLRKADEMCAWQNGHGV